MFVPHSLLLNRATLRQRITPCLCLDRFSRDSRQRGVPAKSTMVATPARHRHLTPPTDSSLLSTPHPPQITHTKQVRPDQRFRLGIGSFVEEYSNKVEIVSLDVENGSFPPAPTHSFTHPYPCTKIMFVPDTTGTMEDLVATTGDYLRIWHIKEDGVELRSLLNNNKNSEFCAPLTSFDW